MTQKEIETRLTYLQEKDRTDPEIYELLVKLTGNMLKSQNWLLSPIDFDNVTHDVAAELFMKVYTGVYTVTYWRALAYRLLKFTYVKKQRQLAMTQTFVTGSDPIKKEELYRTCASCIMSNEREIAIAENKAYLSTLHKTILEVLRTSKFDEKSVEFLNLHTSVALSLLYNEDKFYHISDGLKPYVHILTEKVKKEISNSGFFSVPSPNNMMANPDFENALMPDIEFLGLGD